MKPVNIYQAKTQLSKLVEQAHAGKSVVIAKAGKPMARLVPYVAARAPRKPGLWKGKVRIAPDFDTLPKQVLEQFYGSGA